MAKKKKSRKASGKSRGAMASGGSIRKQKTKRVSYKKPRAKTGGGR